MNRFNVIRLPWVFLLSLVVAGQTTRLVRAADKQPVRLDVLLPEDAELEVDDYKTKATGETRRFASPPMEMGKTYAYSLKVTWRGEVLTRRVQVHPGELVTLDLRKDLQALTAPRPKGSFALLVPPALLMQVYQHEMVPLRVKRFDFPGSIHIRFESLPRGITVPPSTLSDDQNESMAMLFAAADAPPGTHELRVVAVSGDTKEVATMKVMIVRPEKKETTTADKTEKKPANPPENKVEHKTEPTPVKTVEPKPEPKPAPTPQPQPESKPSPQFRIVLPERVEMQPGQTRLVEVTVTRQNGEPLPDDTTILLETPATSNLTGARWTSTRLEPGSTGYTVGFALGASAECEPGERRVKVSVTASTMKAERTITVVIQARKNNGEAKTAPIAPLQLQLPAAVELRGGRTTLIQMRVQTKDGSPLLEAPKVMLDSPSDARLRFALWTSSFKDGDSTSTIGIAVTAESNARAGKCDVPIRVVAGPSTAEGSLKAAIKPSPPPTAP